MNIINSRRGCLNIIDVVFGRWMMYNIVIRVYSLVLLL
jgi:hypothetical protein